MCGFAVDCLRSCYSSVWNFPEVGPVPGYYYFNDKAPPFPGWTFFGSRNWHRGDGSPWPEFGEMEDAKQVWRNGSFGTRFPELVTIGTPAELQGDVQIFTPAPTLFNLGVDVRCWPSGVPWSAQALGGMSDGGDAIATVDLTREGVGGVQDGGSAIAVEGEFRYATGGDATGGLAIHQSNLIGNGQGGDLVGGSVSPTIAMFRTASGGDATGGTSTVTVAAKRTASGGSKSNGTGSP